ncbi:MAG: hypothetical protein EKK42_32825 [Pseudonocardiaceae bacterium]|nr:MAG: hypothetical protein EKK42_32825 [Pseudonocardiaceae bacterium]
MSAQPEPDSQAESDRLDVAVDQAIAACGGDLRSTIRALILANEYFEWELERSVSRGFKRGLNHGRFKCYSG